MKPLRPFIVLLLVGAPTWAQTPPAPAPKPAPPAAEAAKPATLDASADFLRSIDRVDVMAALGADVERQRDGLTLTLDLLRRQMNQLIQQLNAQVPEGYEWDAAARNFKLKDVPAPPPPPKPQKPTPAAKPSL